MFEWEVLPWAAVCFSLVGIIVNAREGMSCWAIWLVSNVMWIAVALHREQPADLVLWSAFVVANVYGWYSWSKRHERHEHGTKGGRQPVSQLPAAPTRRGGQLPHRVRRGPPGERL
jgi:nicotinamide riboside transporter PnuC